MKNLIAIAFLLISSLAQAVNVDDTVPQCPDARYQNEEKLDFSTYAGKVILIDFWATWCPPCKKSMPFLNGLRNELANQGFEIVAINVDENREEPLQFLSANPVNYALTFDAAGNCPSIFDVKAMPSSYLIDKSGKIRHVHLGFRDEDQDKLKKQIIDLLAE